MLNIEKYKDEMADNLDEGFNFEYVVRCAYYNASDENKGDNMLKILDWLCAEYKEPVLDDVEREYLKAVCKPFRNKVKDIQKFKEGKSQFLMINLDNESFALPSFKRDTMYKNMELFKEYTLEELGITYDDEIKNTTITNSGTLNIKL